MAMPDEKMILCQINPLAFLEADAPWASSTEDKPTLESVLRFLCPVDDGVDIEKLLARYREISTEPVRLFAAPAEQRILDKLIWPLRNAKASFMVGNYLGTISLSGMVAEMVAMLLWEITEITDSKINGRPMTKDDEKLPFNSKFERLGQERRVTVLSKYGIIGDKTKSDFDKIRQIRRKYLHFWSQDHDQLPTDGVQSFHAAVSLVLTAFGQDVQQGRLVLNPRLVRYLERHQDSIGGTLTQPG
jgi:roadblock/LC7 domain-containing protein